MIDSGDHPRASGAALPASSSTDVDSLQALLSQPPRKRPPGLGATVGELGAAAVEYAMHGLAVFPLHGIVDGRCTCWKGEPCDRPGKHPKTAHGLKDASCDPNFVLRWWRADPTANIGIATGRISRLVVPDIDGELGLASLTDLVAKHELLPATPRVLTGKGWHLWFRWDEGDPLVKSRTNIRPGIDIRGEGGYVVAPPSRHVPDLYMGSRDAPPAAGTTSRLVPRGGGRSQSIGRHGDFRDATAAGGMTGGRSLLTPKSPASARR
jgi:hypothetical protein